MGRVVIAGGGIIGLFAAWYVKKAGHDVVMVDDSGTTQNCSTGNAGMIVPSHVIPLAAPGVVAKGIRWMFSSVSPFSIQAAINRDLISWAWLFFRSANAKHVQRSLLPLANIGLYSRSLYEDLIHSNTDENFYWNNKGLLMLYVTQKGEQAECQAASLASSAGIDVRILNRDETQAIEPATGNRVRGGVLYPGDAMLSPAHLTAWLQKEIKKMGVVVYPDEAVTSLIKEHGKVTGIITERQEIACDHLVMSAGIWTSGLAKQLGVHIPMRAGKGYSFMVRNTYQLSQPAILSEKKVTVSPFGEQLRFGGTMEITGINHQVNRKRVDGIVRAAGLYYQGYEKEPPVAKAVWNGLRPVSADGLPYLGRSEKWKNVYFSTGHSMMGVSLAPASGKIIAGLISGEPPPFLLQAFSVDRFAC
jgi:D-amino-acid dehydrogenase